MAKKKELILLIAVAVLITVMSLAMTACSKDDLNMVEATVSSERIVRDSEKIESLIEEYSLDYEAECVEEITVYEFADMYNTGDTGGSIKAGNVERSSTFSYSGGEMSGEIMGHIRLVNGSSKKINREKVSEAIGFDVNTVIEIPITKAVEANDKYKSTTCDMRIIYECMLYEKISVERPVGLIAVIYTE
ncbi:MAG: hypothetical protein IKU60_04745 [Clostridia bacterium]|nr:hypothetical protein [Clostridia bacterium]